MENISGLNSEAGMINLIRKRTFNDELRNLVGRVTGHGQTVEKKEIPDRDRNLHSHNDGSRVLEEMHRLFYRARSAVESGLRADSFNPFLLRPSEADTVYDPSEDLTEIFASVGIAGFSVFRYNLKSASYLQTFVSRQYLLPETFQIGIHDGLLSKIIRENNGITVAGFDEITILNPEQDSEFSVAFMMLDTILNPMFKVISPGFSSTKLSINSPILALIFKKNSAGMNEFSELLAGRAAMPLYLLRISDLSSFYPCSGDSPEKIYSKYELIIRHAVESGLSRGLDISIENNSDLTGLAGIDYFKSFVRSNFKNIQAIRVRPGRILFLSSIEDHHQCVDAVLSKKGSYGDGLRVNQLNIHSDAVSRAVYEMVFL